MKISDLISGQGNVEVSGSITEIGEKRSFSKYGRNLMVVHAVLQDDSGSIKLTLWNDDVNRFKEGDKIKVSNGYVKDFQGEKQLTTGKFGTIEKISDNGAPIKESEENSEDSKAESGEENFL